MVTLLTISPPHSQMPPIFPFSLFLERGELLTVTCTVALGMLELLMGFHSICGLGLCPLDYLNLFWAWLCDELCH